MGNQFENLIGDGPFIEDIGKYDKFAVINEWVEKNPKGEIIDFGCTVEDNFFRSKEFERKKLENTEKIGALQRMKAYLLKHINRQVEEELVAIRARLRKQKEEKYRIEDFDKKIKQLSEEGSSVS